MKTFRIKALAFAIAKPTVYADDHDDHHEESSPWEWIIPDEVFYLFDPSIKSRAAGA